MSLPGNPHSLQCNFIASMPCPKIGWTGMRSSPARATCNLNDELGSPSTRALRSRVCHTTIAPNAITKNSVSVNTSLYEPRSDRHAITLAPKTKATITVLIAVKTSPSVNSAAATRAILKIRFAP